MPGLSKTIRAFAANKVATNARMKDEYYSWHSIIGVKCLDCQNHSRIRG